MWTNTLYIQSVELGEVEQKVASPQGAFHLHLKPHHYRGRGTNREVRRETDLHLDFFYTKRKVEDSYPLKKDSLEPSAATGEKGASRPLSKPAPEPTPTWPSPPLTGTAGAAPQHLGSLEGHQSAQGSRLALHLQVMLPPWG